MKVHDESLHCAWGLVSRDGWVVYNDTDGVALDERDWPVGAVCVLALRGGRRTARAPARP